MKNPTLINGRSYNLGVRGAGIWNERSQSFLVDGICVGILDTKYSPYAPTIAKAS